MLLTRELDESIRRAEIAGIRHGVECAQRLRPAAGAGSIEVAGGLVAFFGRESPLSEAFGVGTLAPVTPDEIATITSYYESRESTPRVFVSPLADPTLALGLAAAGYTPSEYENVLASDDFTMQRRTDERIRVAADAGAWAHASAAAFMDRDAATAEEQFVGLLLASSEGVCALEAVDGDHIVATAAMDVRDGCAALFAASTLPAYRGRGWHSALIAERTARARDAGARFMRATARPASTSERNFHRYGFTTLYTRALWERRKPDSNPTSL